MAILLAVSIVSTLLKQLKNHLALKKFEEEQAQLYDDEAYAHDLERTIDQGLNDDTGFEPEEAEWRTLEANEEHNGRRENTMSTRKRLKIITPSVRLNI